MYESMSNEELLKHGEWLIFDDPRHTPESGMHDATKDTKDFIAEMQRRGIDIQSWLDSIPTAAEHKAEAEREWIKKKVEEITNAIKKQP